LHISDRGYVANLKATEADLDYDGAQFSTDQVQLARSHWLMRQEHVSNQGFEMYSMAMTQDRVNIASVEGAIGHAQIAWEHHLVRGPFAAILGMAFVDRALQPQLRAHDG
jgi:hypothetical protein